MSEHVSEWSDLLHGDHDEDYLLNGIKNGFILHDNDTECMPNRHSTEIPKNYRSAREHCTKVEETLISGLEEGHFRILDQPAVFCSPLSAIPKPNGGIRLIHDLSSPAGKCLNDCASKDEDLKFQSVMDAVRQLSPTSYMAKVDLKSAYRSVKIHPSSWRMTGLHWTFTGHSKRTYMCDTRLPFGARKSVSVFHRLTQAISRSLQRKGFCPLVVYIDDFLIIASSFEECQTALQELISQLRALGFRIAWDKVEGPTQRLTFLGVEIDVANNRLTLNNEKKAALIVLLKAYQGYKRLSKKQLQKLAGKLSWAAHVIPWGRLHIRRVFDLLRTLTTNNHKCLTAVFASDLQWWVDRLSEENYCEKLWDTRPIATLFCDASQLGGGAFCLDDWLYTSWSADHPDVANSHINMKELAIVVYAIQRWIHRLRGHRIIVYTDNMAARSILNKCTSPCPQAVFLLRQLTALAMRFDFSVFAVHVPGVTNVLPDVISRFELPRFLLSFPSTLTSYLPRVCYLDDFMFDRHMSLQSVLTVFLQVAGHS